MCSHSDNIPNLDHHHSSLRQFFSQRLLNALSLRPVLSNTYIKNGKIPTLRLSLAWNELIVNGLSVQSIDYYLPQTNLSQKLSKLSEFENLKWLSRGSVQKYISIKLFYEVTLSFSETVKMIICTRIRTNLL